MESKQPRTIVIRLSDEESLPEVPTDFSKPGRLNGHVDPRILELAELLGRQAADDYFDEALRARSRDQNQTRPQQGSEGEEAARCLPTDDESVS